MIVKISAEEHYRLTLIEHAARHFYTLLTDLLNNGDSVLAELNVSHASTKGMVMGAMAELQVVLGESEGSPLRRPARHCI